MTAGVPWWLGVAPAHAEIDCSGGRHRVEWRGGALAYRDHPDMAAEEVLGVLGGAPAGCLAFGHLWRRWSGEPQLITVWRRPGEELEPLDPVRVRPLLAACAREAEFAGAPVRARRRADLLSLLSLPAEMIDRLVLEVFASVSERWSDERFRDRDGLRLGATLATRARPGLARLGAALAPGADAVDVMCSPSAPGEPARISAEIARRGHVRIDAWLPIGWLSDVWARGLSEAAAGFVLAVRGAADDGGHFDVDYAEWTETASAGYEVVPRRSAVRRQPSGGWIRER